LVRITQHHIGYAERLFSNGHGRNSLSRVNRVARGVDESRPGWLQEYPHLFQRSQPERPLLEAPAQ